LDFSGRRTQPVVKEYKNSLLKELEVERDRTARHKNKLDSITSKYETTLEHYKVYNIAINLNHSVLYRLYVRKGISVFGEKSFIHGCTELKVSGI
jgi:hypothetical protein